VPHLRFVGGVLLTLAAALAVFFFLLKPPLDELGLMALFLTATALLSVVAGYAAYRFGWINRAPRISWVVLGSYALASALTFFNVWITARLMFASQHDLLLATVLLLFAGGIAFSVGYFLSRALTDRIVILSRAAGQLAKGDLGTRVRVTGNDEMASLAQSFNDMASQLQTSERQRAEMDTMQRNLIAWAGHDLRTPLASLQAVVEALADGVVDEPEVVERYLGTAKREIRSLSLLIDDLSELAQLQAGGLVLDIEENSLSDLVSDTLESFAQLSVLRKVQLVGSAESDVDPVMMDAKQIGRVLSNLVGNGLRHTPPGGTVSIQVRREADGIRVDVSDTGEGIRSEDLPHIFDQFFRGEPSRSRATGGAGLGLAIAKGIVEAHGGRIGVESTARQGSRFHFTLSGR
jgi:signal transduction histidine kinase